MKDDSDLRNFKYEDGLHLRSSSIPAWLSELVCTSEPGGFPWVRVAIFVSALITVIILASTGHYN